MPGAQPTSAGINHRRIYEHRFRGIDQDARLSVWKVIAPYVWNRMERPDTVLDPAAGRGEFLNAVPAPERWAVDVVDYEEGTYQPDIERVVSDIFTADLPTDHFGGIWVSNFLEHLPDQSTCADFLTKMHSVTAPGGRIAVMGPNFRYCSDEYFDCADHTLALTHVSVEEHLYAAGFEPEATIPRFLPYSFRSRFPASPTLTEWYLKVPLAWRLLGKQFLVIARKR